MSIPMPENKHALDGIRLYLKQGHGIGAPPIERSATGVSPFGQGLGSPFPARPAPGPRLASAWPRTIQPSLLPEQNTAALLNPSQDPKLTLHRDRRDYVVIAHATIAHAAIAHAVFADTS